MATIWDYETAISRRARRPSGKGYTRIYTFENIPSNVAEGLIPAEYSAVPGDTETGNRAAVLMDADLTLEWKPANYATAGSHWYSRAVLFYRPRTFVEWLEANPNHGVLSGHSLYLPQKVKIAPSGTLIEGIDRTDATGQTRWIVQSGNNVLYKHRAVYDVFSIVDHETAASGYTHHDIYFTQFIGNVGRYNAGLMACFPLFPLVSTAAQWMLVEVSSQPRNTYKKLSAVRHRFMLNNDTSLGWADPVVSKKWQIVAKEVDVTDDAGTPTGITKFVATFVPTATTSTVNLIESDGGVFQNINALLSGSW